MKIDDRVLAYYLRRSYHAADGLWFMMVEEADDFERALELDRRVWEVLAKIQAREARGLTNSPGNTPEELAKCFSLKLTADGHQFTAEIASAGVYFTIHGCPWLDLLRKSDRQHLAARVSQTICPTEGRVWCGEFGGEYEFEIPLMACGGGEHCEMRFRRRSNHA
jgi:hypothetical protein